LKIKIIITSLLSFVATALVAQQMPYYTQFKSNMYMINPAITGTKSTLDARMNFRMQWVGYEGAPRTAGLTVHSRLLKGKMGAGMYLMQDNIGPSKQTNLGATYAFHLRFPDVELSFGVAGNFTNHTLQGNLITIHDTQDPSINQSISSSDWVGDGSAGVYLYNDRFHIGLSSLHLFEQKAKFYANDTGKKSAFKYVQHGNFTIGYNYAENPDYVWESTFFANYVQGAPLMVDYTLRMHYKEKMFGGVSIRLRDAVALQMGVSFSNYFQVSYSYDFLISKLRKYSSGSHEIMLAFSHGVVGNKKGRVSKRFIHQRYSYMF